MEMVKLVLCGVLLAEFVLGLITRRNQKLRKNYYVWLSCVILGVLEPLIAYTMAMLDIMSDNKFWIFWVIIVVLDVILLARKIMRQEFVIKLLWRTIALQNLDIDNLKKSNTRH